LRRGVTLVEVLAATALMGTVLVSILLAGARMRAQASRADCRIEACKVADDLLAGWGLQGEALPRYGSGDVRGPGGWRWRTRVVENEAAAAIGAEVVALEVFALNLPNSAILSDAGPLVRVEILLVKNNEDKNI